MTKKKEDFVGKLSKDIFDMQELVSNLTKKQEKVLDKYVKIAKSNERNRAVSILEKLRKDKGFYWAGDRRMCYIEIIDLDQAIKEIKNGRM